jgi:hypothetical protein
LKIFNCYPKFFWLFEKTWVSQGLGWSQSCFDCHKVHRNQMMQFLVIPKHPWATQSCFELGWTYYNMMLGNVKEHPNKCLDIMTTLNDPASLMIIVHFFIIASSTTLSHFLKTSIDIFLINSNDIPRHQRQCHPIWHYCKQWKSMYFCPYPSNFKHINFQNILHPIHFAKHAKN